MRERERRGREMFVPLAHPPGHAQADFGEAVVVIGGVEQKGAFLRHGPAAQRCLVMSGPIPAATAEAWIDGHVHAFAFFGKVPASVLYDNDRCLVAKILPDGTRQRATLFSGFLSHYLFRDRYGRARQGERQGQRGGIGRLFPPQLHGAGPAVRDLGCVQRLSGGAVPASVRPMFFARPVRDGSGSASHGIWPRCPTSLRRRSMPATRPPDGSALRRWCATRPTTTRCPSPTATATSGSGGYVGEVVIGCGGEVIARHPRCYDREDLVFDPIHYLPLIEQKINALDQAAPLAEWDLPPEFATLRRLMEARMIKAGRREYVQVLRLLETFDIDDLHAAVKKALQLGAVGRLSDILCSDVICQAIGKRSSNMMAS